MPKSTPQPLLPYKIKGIAKVTPRHTRDMVRNEKVIDKLNSELHHGRILHSTTDYFSKFHEVFSDSNSPGSLVLDGITFPLPAGGEEVSGNLFIAFCVEDCAELVHELVQISVWSSFYHR